MDSTTQSFFISKIFDRHQSNYSTAKKEALVIVQVLKHFETYLKAVAFEVVLFMDHNLFYFHSLNESQQPTSVEMEPPEAGISQYPTPYLSSSNGTSAKTFYFK